MKPTQKTVKVRPYKMSVAAPTLESKTYDTDFSKWVKEQAKFLKKKEFEQLDMQNLIEEIESLGKDRKKNIRELLRDFINALA